jgi:hypothetical protein
MYRILVQSCDISTCFQRSIIIFELNLDCNDGRRPLFQIRTPTESRVLLLGALRRKAFVRLHLDRRNRGQLMKLQESRTAGGRRHLGWAGKRWNGTEEVSAEDSQTRPTSPAAAVGRGHPSPTLSVALVWYIPSQMPRQPRFWSLLAWLSCLYLSHAVVSKCCCLATCLASGGGNI